MPQISKSVTALIDIASKTKILNFWRSESTLNLGEFKLQNIGRVYVRFGE